MNVEAQVTVNGSKAATWALSIDIEHASAFISGIDAIEVLERPANGLVGLKWRETRTLFGKPATVDKWITDAVENEFYTTRAEDGGFVFVTTRRMADGAGGTVLSERHESRPRGFVSALMTIPMGLFFRGTIKRAILADLNDVKAAVERKATSPA